MLRYFTNSFFFVSCLLIGISCNAEQSEKKFLIGFSQCCDDSWRDVMEAEMYRELAFHPEVGFEFQVANGNSKNQIQQIQELIELGIDLLIVAPNEAEPLTEIIEKTYRSGIPVVLIDRKTESELYTAYIGADNYEIGKMAADYIASKFNGKGNILEIQMAMSISPATERTRGFANALSHYPELKIVDYLEIGWDLENLNRLLPDLYRKYPELDIVFAHTDLLAEQSYQVATRMDRADSLFFVGVDGIPGTGRGIQAVEDGVLGASLLYPTGGVEAIQLALSILHKLPFERQTLLQSTVIDPSNARILNFQMQKVSTLQESIDEQISRIKGLNQIYKNQRWVIFILISSLCLVMIMGGSLWFSLQAKKEINKSLELKNKEVLEKQDQIVQISEEVKRVTQAKVEFFTNISHEFRTPLTLILGFAEDLLPNVNMHKEVKQGTEMIRENAYRLLRLVNQLMDFRKIESGKMKVKASENDLVAFVQHIMKSYYRIAEKRNIDFQLITRRPTLSVWFDGNMIDKVLFNLLSNAFKFTPDGGKIHISISVDKFSNQVNVKMEDNGKGMSEKDVNSVFQPFYQADERQKKGTGIGLPLSKTLVKLHYGDITLQSQVEKGSRFTIILPLGNAHFQEGELVFEQAQNFLQEESIHIEEDFVESPISPPTSHPALAQKILVIEDSLDIQFFLKKKLGDTYEVLQATTGDEGFQLAIEFIPDLIICDIKMPGTSGLEITRFLKSDLRTSHIPVIILSARSTVEQQIQGTKAGADAYITKPFHVQLLQEKIRNLLYNRQVLKENYHSEVLSIQPSTHPNLSPLDQGFVKDFLQYIDENYTRQDLQVTDLCEELNLSRSQIYRKVKALLGQSINDFIQNARLKKAEELLLQGEMNIAEIAYEVGYTSPDYFSTVFKSKFNVVPSQYKKQMGEESPQY